MAQRFEGYDLAFEEGRRAISDQQSALDALSNRAGVIASTATIATSLIGATTLREGPIGLGTRVALICYLAIAVLTGLVLWPRRKWRFHFEPSRLHWYYVDGPRPLPSDLMKRDLALYLEQYFQENGERMKRLSLYLSASIALLFIEVGALLSEVVFIGG